MTDEPILNPQPIKTPAAYRIDEAEINIDVPVVDQNGQIMKNENFNIQLMDSKLTVQQRQRLIDAAKALMKLSGKIA